MTADIDIRAGTPADTPAIVGLYRTAFPDENLVPLVEALLGIGDGVVSLVAVRDARIAGHVGVTLCWVEGGGPSVGLLAPLAVAPDDQRQGIGGALVRAACGTVAGRGAGTVVVLGDPAYYGRFGFAAEAAVTPPYPLPRDWAGAWQSLALTEPADRPSGGLHVPDVWRDPALWR